MAANDEHGLGKYGIGEHGIGKHGIGEYGNKQNPGRQSREMGKSLWRECNFELLSPVSNTRCVLSLERKTGRLVENSNFGYQEGVNSKVVDQ